MSFNHTFRYIDDVLLINNIFHNYVHLKDTTESDKHASYLDIYLNIDSNDRLTITLYEICDDFDFSML
jgi:hypothetical protein